MKRGGKWVVAFLALCMPMIMHAGCATVRGSAPVNIDQSSPKALAASFHDAVESENYAAMLECAEPASQPEFDRILVAFRRSARKIRAVAKMIEEKIGRDEAEEYRTHLEEFTEFRTLSEAVEGGKVDWSKVKFKVDGNRASATIGGETVGLYKKIDGKWYIAGSVESRFARWMYQATLKQLDMQAAAADRHARGIRNGTINKGNFIQKVMGVDEAEGERLARWRATPWGPAVDGVRIRLTTWAPAFYKDERIRFSIEIKYETDEAVCWRIPGMGPNDSRGLGRNVVLEIDGKAIPQPDVKADGLVRAGHGAITDSTSIYFPVDFRLPPGRHTIRYTIISRGGTHTDPYDGKKYRIIKGKLISNTLTFFIKEDTAPDKSAELKPLSKQAISRLLEALKDDDWEMRRAACILCGAMGRRGKNAIPVLRKALRDDNEEVRKAAAEALKRIQMAAPPARSTGAAATT